MNAYQRGDTIVRPFSDAEDALITELRVLGMGTTEIASFASAAGHPPRSQATINMRLKALAVRDEDAESEREEAEDRRRMVSVGRHRNGGSAS